MCTQVVFNEEAITSRWNSCAGSARWRPPQIRSTGSGRAASGNRSCTMGAQARCGWSRPPRALRAVGTAGKPGANGISYTVKVSGAAPAIWRIAWTVPAPRTGTCCCFV